MPNWRKLVVSGSDATLNSLIVNNNITASSVTSSFTGSLEGTSSFALDAGLLDGTSSATFATTGSNTFIGNQTISGSLDIDTDTIILTGSLEVSGSISLSGSLEVTEDIIGNLDGTASFALTASFIDGGFY
jgi:predicted acyltransferase (DUF342 family)